MNIIEMWVICGNKATLAYGTLAFEMSDINHFGVADSCSSQLRFLDAFKGWRSI